MSTISAPVFAGIQIAESLSRPVSPWMVFKATIVKDLQMARRYLPDLIGRVVELAIRMAFFFLMSTVLSYKNVEALAGGSLSDRNLFLFLQASALLLVFSGTALSAP